MAYESDGADEMVSGAIRVAVTVALRAAEQRARQQEERARAAEAANAQQAQENRARVQAERTAARAELAPIAQDRWWDTAKAADIGRAWETAKTWERLDPDAARTVETIRDQLRVRYGVDVDNPDADPERVEAAERSQAQAQAQAQAPRERADADRDLAEAAVLMASAERAERQDEPAATQQDRDAAHLAYDSAARREQLAGQLERDGLDADVIHARLIADTGQAEPPQSAVKVDAYRNRSRLRRSLPSQRQPGLDR